jgi:hypothetical protein
MTSAGYARRVLGTKLLTLATTSSVPLEARSYEPLQQSLTDASVANQRRRISWRQSFLIVGWLGNSHTPGSVPNRCPP